MHKTTFIWDEWSPSNWRELTLRNWGWYVNLWVVDGCSIAQTPPDGWLELRSILPPHLASIATLLSFNLHRYPTMGGGVCLYEAPSFRHSHAASGLHSAAGKSLQNMFSCSAGCNPQGLRGVGVQLFFLLTLAVEGWMQSNEKNSLQSTAVKSDCCPCILLPGVKCLLVGLVNCQFCLRLSLVWMSQISAWPPYI